MKHYRNNRIFNIALLLTVCLALVVASAGLKVSAHKDGGLLGDVPVVRSTIVIDAMKEAAYNDGLTIEIKYPKSEEQSVGATGFATLLCTDGYLYVFFEVIDEDTVYDPNPDFQKSSPWKTESCEVFINEKNSANEQDVIQYRIDWTGWPSVYTKTGTANYGSAKVGNAFGYAASRSTNGYKAEFRIPLKTAGQNVLSGTGSEIGIHFQINDVKDEEGNLHWATEYSAATGSGADSWQVEAYPYVTLGASGTAPVATEEPTDAPTEEPTAEPTEEPTDEPTAEPSEAPVETPEPTEEVTEPATEEATEAPTDEPPAEPTEEPTGETDPTDEPAPTDAPETVEPAAETEAPATDAPSDATPEPADSTAEPAATDKPSGKKGCGNTLGGAAALILAAATAFVALKSKKNG